jgi:hypothetical protein
MVSHWFLIHKQPRLKHRSKQQLKNQIKQPFWQKMQYLSAGTCTARINHNYIRIN